MASPAVPSQEAAQDGFVSFRDRMRRESDHNTRIFQLARAGRALRLPRHFLHIKTLHDDKGTHVTPAAKIRAVLRYNFPGGHAKRRADSRNAPTLELPLLESRSEYSASPKPQDGEVAALIKRLKPRKAAGEDEIRGELFKIIADFVVPYLEHVFAACLRFSYQPEAFKIAITILLPKLGPRTGDVPKDLRPISLLSIPGKMLEKMVATRLRTLCESHALLPTEQFGFAGRCTTSAQQYLLNHVYRVWLLKLKVTLLSLDMAAAFDRVPRHKLLKILADKGISGWIIRFVHLFLSRRSTYFRIPGYTSRRFWVTVGVPQGSPLSPILGIIVDHQLRWHDQINDIENKVTRRVAYLKHISGKTWGSTLGRMIQLYKTMVRPLFPTVSHRL